MAYMWLAASLALFAFAVGVSCETCPEAQVRAEEYCGGRLGCFRPVCDGDAFDAVQCHGSVCYCVTPSGNQIQSYQFQYADYSNSQCECAREKAAGNTSLVCKSDGDYM